VTGSINGCDTLLRQLCWQQTSCYESCTVAYYSEETRFGPLLQSASFFIVSQRIPLRCHVCIHHHRNHSTLPEMSESQSRLFPSQYPSVASGYALDACLASSLREDLSFLLLLISVSSSRLLGGNVNHGHRW
jgi:hypothetical protein